MSRRWLILFLILPVYALILSWIAVAAATVLMEPMDGWRVCWDAIVDPDWEDAIDFMSEAIYWAYFGGPALLVAATQWLFLLPVTAGRPQRGEQGKSLWMSFVLAGVVGAGLATGLFLAVISLAQLMMGMKTELPRIGEGPVPFVVWIALPLGVSWILWSLLIGAFARRQRHPLALRRLLAWLIAGTIVEVLIVLPIDIMVRRRTNCYCDTGSAHALGISVWACLWLAGPGIVLAVLSKRRRLWWDTHCNNCGYEKGPSPGEKCPECGNAWGEAGMR